MIFCEICKFLNIKDSKVPASQILFFFFLNGRQMGRTVKTLMDVLIRKAGF